MNDFIVTGIERNGRSFLAAAYYRDRVLTELSVKPDDAVSHVGKVYVGYVESVAKNIGGAFIRVSKNLKCFLPNYRSLAAKGDVDPGHMLIMVTKDASGVKEAVCQTKIEIAGKYSVLSRGKTSLSISKKLSGEDKELLKKWLNPHDYPGLHILLRTNAMEAEKSDILNELSELKDKLDSIYERAESAKTGACLYEPQSFYISMLRDLYEKPDRAFSDIPKIAEELKCRMSGDNGICTLDEDDGGSGNIESQDEDLCLMKPRTLSLAQLYNLEHDLDKLMQKIVWLKSGAYLVIERTEAFVIIDVNSGRCGKGKNPQETYRRINLEAGEEVLRQLRLRDFSGMILIDFISMESEDHQIELVNVMRKKARSEHRRTDVLDLTKLGILEMVREKKGQPLDEIIPGVTSYH